MNYRKSKGKIILNKDGVYMAFTDDEIGELQEIISDIQSGENKFYVEDARREQQRHGEGE